MRRPLLSGIMYVGEEASRKGDNVERNVRDEVRDEVLIGLVYRARTDLEFKRNVYTALDRLLIDEYRYNLTEAELEICRAFWRDTLHLTEEELDHRLREIADPAGPVEGI